MKKERPSWLSILNIFLAGVLAGTAFFFFSFRGGDETGEKAPEAVYTMEAQERPTESFVLPQELNILEAIQEGYRSLADRVIPTVVELQVVELVDDPMFNFFNFPLDLTKPKREG